MSNTREKLPRVLVRGAGVVVEFDDDFDDHAWFLSPVAARMLAHRLLDAANDADSTVP